MPIRINLAFLWFFFILLVSCGRNNEENYFDFSKFEQAGMAQNSNNKLLIYINLHNTTGSRPMGMDFSCEMGMPHQLKPYIISNNHDVLFLIDTPKEKLSWLKDRLADWCFDKDYLIVHATPSFFRKARRQGVHWVSCFFSKDGIFIDYTNPSMPNFKKLMGPPYP